MTLYPLIFILVVLIGYAVSAGDDCAAEARRPKQCYHCSTYSNEKYCADPFNKSHPNVKTITCEGSCAKWVRKPKRGPDQYIRTCSTNLNLQMPVSLVCMKESRPGDGHLCFCNKKGCNRAGGAQSLGLLPLLIISLVGMLVSQTLLFTESEPLIGDLNRDFTNSREDCEELGDAWRRRWRLRTERLLSVTKRFIFSASYTSGLARSDCDIVKDDLHSEMDL